MVVVRPDQYVAHVLPLDAHEALADFFAGILIDATRAPGLAIGACGRRSVVLLSLTSTKSTVAWPGVARQRSPTERGACGAARAVAAAALLSLGDAVDAARRGERRADDRRALSDARGALAAPVRA